MTLQWLVSPARRCPHHFGGDDGGFKAAAVVGHLGGVEEGLGGQRLGVGEPDDVGEAVGEPLQRLMHTQTRSRGRSR
jgi:hypothetical protein